MKYLKLFENHQTEAEISEICKNHHIYNWTINSEGLIDVDNSVYFSNNGLTKLPLKFGTVTGGFYCCNNELTSLEGAPHTVGDNFSCGNNKLTSLKGSPRSVGGDFSTWNTLYEDMNNDIRTFEGLVNISGDLYCNLNPVWEIWNLINPGTNKWDSEKMDFFNDLDIIRGEEIAIERLNFFLEEMGLPTVEKVRGYKNIY